MTETETAMIVTGLEQWATPVLIFVGCATLLATTISLARFQATSYSGVSSVTWIVTVILAICSFICISIGLIVAIFMAPLDSHFKLAITLWAINLAPALLCLKKNSQK